MGLNEIYPEPKETQNTIEVPLDAFLALTKAVRDIRELHVPDEQGDCNHCSENGWCWGCQEYSPSPDCTCIKKFPCPTIKTLEQFDALQEGNS